MATASKRSRLAPEQRREQILERAQALLAERSYDELTTVDIARAAGVTRALVHHYFGGKREIYLELANRLVASTLELPPPNRKARLRKRVAAQTDEWLDWAERNRVPWLAVTGQGEATVDDAIVAVAIGGREMNVERMLRYNDDLLDDTPQTRFALRSFVVLVQQATRDWLLGNADRNEVHTLLTELFIAIVRQVGPALDRQASAAPVT